MIRLLCLDISQADRAQYEACYQAVCEERKKHADKYHFFEDKKRCIFSEILLRYAYAGSGGDAYGMRIEYRKNEKPYLSSDENFRFNLSHTGEMIVLAYGTEVVGVDVEKIDRNINKEQISGMVFTDEEKNWLLEVKDSTEQNERFFRLWTAKESYLKYLGTGLRKSAKSFSVDLENHCLNDNTENEEAVCFKEIFLKKQYVITSCQKTDRIEYKYLTFSDLRADPIIMRRGTQS